MTRPMLLAVALVLVFVGSRAHAYCAESDRSAFAAEIQAGDEIPVYIVTDGSWSVLPDAAKTDGSRGTNMTWYQVYGATVTAISRWNSSSKVRLRYAGTADSPTNPDALTGFLPNNAIFVTSPMWCQFTVVDPSAAAYEWSLNGVENIFTNEIKYTSIIHLKPSGTGQPGGSCTQTASPYVSPQWTNVRPHAKSSFRDAVSTLIHELGHSLGLLHPENTGADCDLTDGDNSSNLVTLMNSTGGGHRRPMRDV